MSNKTARRANAGMAFYYGISSLIVAIGGVLGMGIWLFKVRSNEADFSWGILVTLIVVTIVMAGMAYALLRVGAEEIER
jgi:phosphate/sulfate permease